MAVGGAGCPMDSPAREPSTVLLIQPGVQLEPFSIGQLRHAPGAANPEARITVRLVSAGQSHRAVDGRG